MGNTSSLPLLPFTKVSYSCKGEDLEYLPVAVPETHPLELLDASGNRMKKLPTKLHSLQLLDLSDNKYYELPYHIEQAILSYPLLNELWLSSNKLTVLPSCLEKLGTLHTLFISNNNLTEFNIELPNLRFLDISRNKLEVLQMESETMMSLNCSYNLIKTLDIKAPNLKGIYANGNNLTYFDGEFPIMKTLDLSFNRILECPDIMAIAPKVENLNLAMNYLYRLCMLPDTITDINISYNSLTVLPDSFVRLRGLVRLIANNNFLRKIPLSFSRLKMLRIDNNRLEKAGPISFNARFPLRFDRNALQSIPDFSRTPVVTCSIYGNCLTSINVSAISRGISSLDVSSNQLETLPDALFELQSLRHLVLNNNLLKELPSSISNSSITALDISRNPIASFPALPISISILNASHCDFAELPESLGELQRLAQLDISNNNISSMPAIQSLQTLNASCNKLTGLQYVYKNLQELDLSNNMISSFAITSDPSVSFAVMCTSQLRLLNLSSNALTSLSISMYSDIEDLKLENNPDLDASLEFVYLPELRFIDIINTKVTFMDDIPDTLFELLCSADAGIDTSKAFVRPSNVKHSGYSSMQGIRPEMEDAFTIVEDIFPSSSMYCLFDGHAGRALSGYAARAFPRIMRQFSSFSVNSIASSIIQLNDELHTNLVIGGSTMCSIFIRDNTLIWANIGDSRSLIVRKDGSVFPLSYDHKPYNREEFEHIRSLGSFIGEMRVAGVLAVSRALGDFTIDGVVGTPSVSEYTIFDDDFRAVIACDGVFDVLSNEDVGSIALSSPTPFHAADAIRNLSFVSQSQDNISVIVIDLHPSAPAE